MGDKSERSSLETFVEEICLDIFRYAFERVAESCDYSSDTEEDILLVELDNDLPTNNSPLNEFVDADIEDSKSDLESVNQHDVHARCCKLVEDVLVETYADIKCVFDEERLAMADEAAACERQIQLLQCIQSSGRIQDMFETVSGAIIQSALQEVKEEARQMNNDFESIGSEREYMPNEAAWENSSPKGDILEVNIRERQDNGHTNYVDDNYDLSIEQEPHIMDGEIKTLDDIPGDSTTKSIYFDAESESYKLHENTDRTLSEKAGFTTANSTMFDITPIQEDDLSLEPTKEHFSSFTNMETPDNHSGFDVNTPDCEKYHGELNKTLTGTELRVPRQSTPLAMQNSPQSINISSNSSNSIFGSSPCSTNENNKDLNNTEQESEVFTDDEVSSLASTPRTLSRHSSAFGNVTLEFDNEWESGIHGSFHNGYNSGEVKHTVVLHELSFDERADLKAPDLLGPVFLAVQDDDEDVKKKHKLSQSIDDLCEMISDDEDQTELSPRKRAMSLETRQTQISKSKNIKVPTKEELIQAFQELRNEIMEAKDFSEEVEEKGGDVDNNEIEKIENVVEESISMKGSERSGDDEELDMLTEEGGDEDADNLATTEDDLVEQNIEEQELTVNRPEGDDPLRWQTVVFNGQHKVIDLKILEPFLKVLTHGGYHHEDGKKSVIVVLTACNLPNRNMNGYGFVMEQLFFFLVSTMDILITSEEYIFVYFHGGADKNQSPTYSWLKKYYQHIDRRLRKSVTNVYIVHPNFWLKSIYRLSRPFLSSNFVRKLKFVSSIRELSKYIKTDFIHIPDEVISIDPNYKKIHAM